MLFLKVNFKSLFSNQCQTIHVFLTAAVFCLDSKFKKCLRKLFMRDCVLKSPNVKPCYKFGTQTLHLKKLNVHTSAVFQQQKHGKQEVIIKKILFDGTWYVFLLSDNNRVTEITRFVSGFKKPPALNENSIILSYFQGLK